MLTERPESVQQSLLGRVNKKLQYRVSKIEPLSALSSGHLGSLNTAKEALATQLGWIDYDPKEAVTDSRVSGLIRARNKAKKTGQPLSISSEAQQALDTFITERRLYQRDERTLGRYQGEINDLSRWSTYLQQGEGVVDDLVAKETEKKKPNALQRDLVGFVLANRVSATEQQVERPKEDLAAAPEGKTRGFLARLKEIPETLINSAAKARRLIATGVLGGAIGLTILAGCTQQQSKEWPEHTFSGESYSSLASTCPNYDILSRYDWDIKIACQTAKAYLGSNPAGVRVNPDGSKVYGQVLPINNERLKEVDPNLDSEHLKGYINNRPEINIAFAYELVSQRGWSALR